MDTNLVLRASSAGNLTGDATLTDVAIKPMVAPLYLHMNVPAVSTSDTLTLQANFEADGTTLVTQELAAINTVGHYVLAIFCDDPDTDALSVVLDLTANNSVAMNFGAVEVWISNSRVS
jgi:hypothetical protein